MTIFDWSFLGILAICYGGILILEIKAKRELKKLRNVDATITIDVDKLMPGEVFKASNDRIDLAILAYEDLEALCSRAGYRLSDRTAKKAVWEPRK